MRVSGWRLGVWRRGDARRLPRPASSSLETVARGPARQRRGDQGSARRALRASIYKAMSPRESVGREVRQASRARWQAHWEARLVDGGGTEELLRRSAQDGEGLFERRLAAKSRASSSTSRRRRTFRFLLRDKHFPCDLASLCADAALMFSHHKHHDHVTLLYFDAFGVILVFAAPSSRPAVEARDDYVKWK